MTGHRSGGLFHLLCVLFHAALLVVVAQQVIPIDARAADGRMLVETSMGSMPVVGIEPGVKLLAALL